MTKAKRYWIPNLKPMVIHEGFPESVYDQCVAGMTLGDASLERVAAHIASNGTSLPEVFVLTISIKEYPKEPFSVGIRLENPFLKDHVPLLTANDATPMPSSSAEFLFYLFMSSQNCDALVGDLEERYKLIHRRFGRRRANLWYWTQAIRSVGPIVWAWAKKVSLKPVAAVVAWAVAKGLLGHDSWLAALVELWKKIRS